MRAAVAGIQQFWLACNPRELMEFWFVGGRGRGLGAGANHTLLPTISGAIRGFRATPLRSRSTPTQTAQLYRSWRLAWPQNPSRRRPEVRAVTKPMRG